MILLYTLNSTLLLLCLALNSILGSFLWVGWCLLFIFHLFCISIPFESEVEFQNQFHHADGIPMAASRNETIWGWPNETCHYGDIKQYLTRRTTTLGQATRTSPHSVWGTDEQLGKRDVGSSGATKAGMLNSQAVAEAGVGGGGIAPGTNPECYHFFQRGIC